MTISIRRLLPLLAVLALALGVTACGSDDDGGGNGGSSGGSTETQAETQPETQTETEASSGSSGEPGEYLEAINGAQREFAAEAGKLNLAQPSSPEDFKDSLDQLVGLIDTLIGELEDVTPPEQVATEHDQLISSLEDYNGVLEREKGDLASGDNAAVRGAAQAIGEASTDFQREFQGIIRQINRNLG